MSTLNDAQNDARRTLLEVLPSSHVKPSAVERAVEREMTALVEVKAARPSFFVGECLELWFKWRVRLTCVHGRFHCSVRSVVMACEILISAHLQMA